MQIKLTIIFLYSILLTDFVRAETVHLTSISLLNQSVLKILLSILAILGCIYLIIRLMTKRDDISGRKAQGNKPLDDSEEDNHYKTQALLAEQKIINLENEKMKIEMIHRDKELANQTMDLIRKNKFLVKIAEELDKVNRLSSDQTINSKINALIQKINKEIDNEKQWEIFETAFDDVHEDFLTRLKQKYPSLTPKELKLCAYLRLNISTKEIAPLMNISIRGVEICRYRVRKKLNIDRDQNLTSMIMEM
jgi:DNA-binding CsgD family transcriptional regulator